jgi:hypothetical protein
MAMADHVQSPDQPASPTTTFVVIGNNVTVFSQSDL